MKWQDLRRSSNVEDARGEDGGGGNVGGGQRLGLPIGRKTGGIGFILILAVAYFIGGPNAVMNMLSSSGGVDPNAGNAGAVPGQVESDQVRPTSAGAPSNDEGAQFVAATLGSTEDVWTALFQAQGKQYIAPHLKMFTSGVRTACGENSSAVGPFYCPPDQKVYIDLDFYNELAQMGGPGDFAKAYVIGHEVGHHVQNLLGISGRVQQLQERASEEQRNQLQVRVELQADCFAGVWAYHANQTHHVLEPGDVESGLAAAKAIGDDTLQRNAGRRVSPESFTHGASADRMQWLKRGLSTGDMKSCDTFAGT